MSVKEFGYSYSDIFDNNLDVYFTGGDCTVDVNDHLRENLQNVRGLHYAMLILFSEEPKNLLQIRIFWKIPIVV